MVHGDDFVSVGSVQAATEFRNQLQGRFEIKTQVLGPPELSGKESASLTKGLAEGIMQEGRVLNRIIRWTEDGWEVEPDQRHVDIMVRDLSLQEAKPVSTPGEPEQRWEEEENAKVVGDVDMHMNHMTGKWQSGSKQILAKITQTIPSATWEATVEDLDEQDNQEILNLPDDP